MHIYYAPNAFPYAVFSSGRQVQLWGIKPHLHFTNKKTEVQSNNIPIFPVSKLKVRGVRLNAPFLASLGPKTPKLEEFLLGHTASRSGRNWSSGTCLGSELREVRELFQSPTQRPLWEVASIAPNSVLRAMGPWDSNRAGDPQVPFLLPFGEESEWNLHRSLEGRAKLPRPESWLCFPSWF